MDLSLWKMIDECKSIDALQSYLKDDNNTLEDRKLLKDLMNDWSLKYSINLKDYDITEKWLIILILMSAYPDELDLTDDMILYNKAISLVNSIKNSDYSDDFGKKLITVKLLYDKWKKDDWNMSMKLIIGMYLQYTTVIENAEKNIYGGIDNNLINLWKIYRDELLNMVKEISPGRYNYHIERYNNIYNNTNECLINIEKNVRDEVYNEYWTNMKLIYKYPYQGNLEPIFKSVIDDYNLLRHRLCKLLNVSFEDVVVIDLNEHNVIWVLINDIKRFDSQHMDRLYDNLYIKWNNKATNIDFIDIIRLIYDRMEIIISLLNKKDV
jgi:hypothetical protein